MKQYFLIFSLLISSLFISCDKSPTSLPEHFLYQNSFETEEDLNDFDIGFAEVRRSEEAPNQGGSHSLFVSGGCIVPHLSAELGPFTRDHTIAFSTWARMFNEGSLGGSGLSFSIGSSSEDRRSITVVSDEWEYYESEPLFVPAGDLIHVNFLCGGIAEGTTLFDMIALVSI